MWLGGVWGYCVLCVPRIGGNAAVVTDKGGVGLRFLLAGIFDVIFLCKYSVLFLIPDVFFMLTSRKKENFDEKFSFFSLSGLAFLAF